MANSNARGPATLVPLKKVLRNLLTPKPGELQRWVLSGRATGKLKALSAKTGIDQSVLADAAVDALHAALAGDTRPQHIRDARLRVWLQAQSMDGGGKEDL